MDRLDLVQQSLSALGPASPQEISVFIREKYGFVINPPLIALLRAILWQEEHLSESCRQAREASTPFRVRPAV